MLDTCFAAAASDVSHWTGFVILDRQHGFHTDATMAGFAGGVAQR